MPWKRRLENKSPIRALREVAGLSVRQVANQLQVSQVTVWGWENGTHGMTGARMGEVANLYGVGMEVILDAVNRTAALRRWQDEQQEGNDD